MKNQATLVNRRLSPRSFANPDRRDIVGVARSGGMAEAFNARSFNPSNCFVSKGLRWIEHEHKRTNGHRNETESVKMPPNEFAASPRRVLRFQKHLFDADSSHKTTRNSKVPSCTAVLSTMVKRCLIRPASWLVWVEPLAAQFDPAYDLALSWRRIDALTSHHRTNQAELIDWFIPRPAVGAIRFFQ